MCRNKKTWLLLPKKACLLATTENKSSVAAADISKQQQQQHQFETRVQQPVNGDRLRRSLEFVAELQVRQAQLIANGVEEAFVGWSWLWMRQACNHHLVVSADWSPVHGGARTRRWYMVRF